MYIPATAAVMVLHLLTFAASTPLPDVRGNDPPPPPSDVSSSSGPSSSSTWTQPSVSVGNSIQMNDRDLSQPLPSTGSNSRRNDLFGSVDSSLGSSRPTVSTAQGDQLQRDEQTTERQPPAGGWKDKRQLHDVGDHPSGFTTVNRPILSGEDVNGPQA